MHHAPNAVQLSTLISIKTGGCPEDCGYCPQAARFHTGVDNEAMLDIGRSPRPRGEGGGRDALLHGRGVARAEGRDLVPVLAMVREVKALGLETCATLGMLKDGQARSCATPVSTTTTTISIPRPNSTARSSHARVPRSPRHARSRSRRRDPRVLWRHRRHGRDAQHAGRADRAARQSRALPGIRADQPSGAGRGHAAASASRRRSARSAGIRAHDRRGADHHAEGEGPAVRRAARLGDAIQALCFLAGANSIFYGERLLTTGNPDVAADRALFANSGSASGYRDPAVGRFPEQLNLICRRPRE